MRTLDVSTPFTAAASEAILRHSPEVIHALVSGTVRCGPAAEGRLLGLMAAVTRDGGHVETTLNYYLASSALESSGWTNTIENPVAHILAHYSKLIRDYSGEDVTNIVRTTQSRSRVDRGLVTRTGGLTAFLAQNEAIANGQARGVFAEVSATVLEERLDSLSLRRGGKGLHPALVAFAAEAIENVREHATSTSGVDPAGLALVEIRRTNRNQFPALKSALPAGSAFTSYLDMIERKFGDGLAALAELTVADTGAGIAATVAGGPSSFPSPDAEFDALLTAFSPGGTRKLTKGSGGGFTTMLRAVTTLDGAIQIRSGRWSLYRSARTRVGGNTKLPGDSYDRPESWEIAEVAPVMGTSITLLIPVIRVDE